MTLNYPGVRIASSSQRRLYSAAINAYTAARADGASPRQSFAVAEAALDRLRATDNAASPRFSARKEDNDV